MTGMIQQLILILKKIARHRNCINNENIPRPKKVN